MRAGTNRRRACSERTQNGPSYRRIYRRKYYLARYASDEAGLPIGFSVPSDRRAKLLAAVRQERSRGTEKAGGDEKREKERRECVCGEQRGEWSTSPNFRPVCTVRHNSTAFRMPFVSSFLSVHLSERTGALPASHLFPFALPLRPANARERQRFLPAAFTSRHFPSDAPFRREGKERPEEPVDQDCYRPGERGTRKRQFQLGPTESGGTDTWRQERRKEKGERTRSMSE